MIRFRVLARSMAAPLLLAVVVTGCGGGGSSAVPTTTTTTAPPLTKTQYIREANSICTSMNAAIDAVPDPGDDKEKLAAGLDQVTSIAKASLAKLRALRPPAGDEAALEAIYAKVDVVLADYEQLSTALRSGDTTTANSLQRKGPTDQKAANDAAIAYGLTVCGE